MQPLFSHCLHSPTILPFSANGMALLLRPRGYRHTLIILTHHSGNSRSNYSIHHDFCKYLGPIHGIPLHTPPSSRHDSWSARPVPDNFTLQPPPRFPDSCKYPSPGCSLSRSPPASPLGKNRIRLQFILPAFLVMSSGFVSAGTNEAPVERDDEWLKAQQELEEERRRKAEIGKQNDGKSLYEVLQQNKSELLSCTRTCPCLFAVCCVWSGHATPVNIGNAENPWLTC